jgi:hypothetical protein
VLLPYFTELTAFKGDQPKKGKKKKKSSSPKKTEQ